MKILLIMLVTALCRLPSLAQSNPVIVELFTSQGCSSCPAADLNLTEILQEAKKEGTPVYGLSFHVDYWNYIGWKDPYSRKAFTERQRAYGEKMAMESIYTPQLIINGKIELVGSDKSKSAKAIEDAQSQKPVFQITIEKLELDDGVIKIRYALDKEPNGEMVNMAVVETKIENPVTAGENKGRTLHHDNVVRIFSTGSLRRSGEIALPAPGLNPAKASVILYIQNRDWHVVGAVAKSLSR